MGILNAIFHRHFGPVFVKECDTIESLIEKLNTLSEKAEGKLKKEIALVVSGLYGEKQIAYELKNSGMDMLVAHDLHLEKNGLSAQIDFLAVTPKHVFVIECKNLYGNIEIDDNGNFIRHMGQGTFYRREGFASPVSQNERHLNVLKEIRNEYKNNILTKTIFAEKVFPQVYRSIVVLANPKTILNDKKAPKEVRDIVIRSDQLVSYIKRLEEADDLYRSPESEMRDLMDSFLKCSLPNQEDYVQKFEKMLHQSSPEKVEKGDSEKLPDSPKKCPRCGAPLVLRVAKSGKNVGNQFWGCSSFPKCWYKE